MTVKVQWTKEICSLDTEANDDVGIFEDLPNGDALEKGSMPNPDNEDKMQDYEEVWGAITVPSSTTPNWILRAKNQKGVTYIGRVAGYFQVLRKGKDGFAALREQQEGGKWVGKYEVGANLPSIKQLGESVFDAGSWKKGQEVEVSGDTYEVYALEKA